MSELTKLNLSPVKVTVARPLGRAASSAGGRAVEAVPPVVLDNETALGFLHEKAGEGNSGRSRSNSDDDSNFSGKQLPQSDRRLARDTAGGAEAYARGKYRASGIQRFSRDDTVLRGASNAGFATHLMAQTDEGNAADPESVRRQLAERHSLSSDAYRRAGAEPLLYGQASQVISVAI